MTRSLKIIFMGTPEAAAPSLKALIDAEMNVIGVVTQPDRPSGRGQELTSPPIASLAKDAGLTLWQPSSVKDPSFIRDLKTAAPDVIVIVAYGQILPRAILDLPPHGCINVHFSLLPAYRGPAPVHWALINGDEATGVTIFRLTERVDAGPILAQHKVPILPEDNVESLEKRLANAGAELLIQTVDKLRSETLEAYPQREALASRAPRLKKEDGVIDWSRGATALLNQIRGMTPWPGAVTTLAGKKLKIHRAALSAHPGVGEAGTVTQAGPAGVVVACGKGGLILQELQLEGGSRLTAAEFLNGHPIGPGTKLG